MKEPLRLSSAIHSIRGETARPLPRRRIVLMSVLGWTLFVGVALWWLLRGDTRPSLWIIHDSEPLRPAVTEKVQGFFKTDLGFQRVYPWILFGPYAALIAFCFPLERGRLRLSLPANLAACALFVVASQLIGARTSTSAANVVIVSSQHKADASGGRETNKVQVEMIRINPEKPLREQMPGGLAMERSTDRI